MARATRSAIALKSFAIELDLNYETWSSAQPVPEGSTSNRYEIFFLIHRTHKGTKRFRVNYLMRRTTVSWDRSAELFSRATSSPHILCFFLIILRLLRKSFFTFWLTQKAILCDTLSPLCDIKLTFVHSKSIRRCGTLIFYFSMRQQLKICHLAKANSACLSRKMWFKTAEGFSFFSLS